MSNLINFDFENQLVRVELQDGEQYVAVRPIVENMGLDWKVQHRKLVDNPKFNCGHMTTVAQDGRNPLDKVDFLFYSIWQGASKHPLHSVIATPSGFLLPILSVMGKMNLSVKTVARLCTCFEHLVHPTSNRVKSQYTGVLANV